MADRHLILCGGSALTGDRAWSGVTPLSLRIGDGRNDVHLQLGRMLKRLGSKATDIEADLLELAAYVYAADQVIRRGGTKEFEYGLRWRRHFRFEVPVRRPAIWRRPAVTELLQWALGFLTDDDYEFGFCKHPEPPPLEDYLFGEVGRDPRHHDFTDVILFSGGLDSLAGAVREILIGQRRVVLVSHRPTGKILARQQALIAAIEDRLPDPQLRPLHVPLEANKRKNLGRDFNQRSRSFLFAAAAAVVARLLGLRSIRFFENGLTSLNLPLSRQVLGGRASRTTHPKVLDACERLLRELFQPDFVLDNPFRWMTKADVLAEIKAAGHGSLSAQACSCSHTWQSSRQYPH